MQARLTAKGGEARIQVISILEDLWEDCVYFRESALSCEGSNGGDGAAFSAARYRRVALVLLMAYLEGVVNTWGKQIVPATRLEKWCRQPLFEKIQALSRKGAISKLREAQELRNKLVHLRPGFDLQIYDSVSSDLLRETEKDVVEWLSKMEEKTGRRRHPDTKQFADVFSATLGKVTSETHST